MANPDLNFVTSNEDCITLRGSYFVPWWLAFLATKARRHKGGDVLENMDTFRSRATSTSSEKQLGVWALNEKNSFSYPI